VKPKKILKNAFMWRVYVQIKDATSMLSIIGVKTLIKGLTFEVISRWQDIFKLDGLPCPSACGSSPPTFPATPTRS
jgi:hypothetical protein